MSGSPWIWQTERVIASETAVAQRLLEELLDSLRQRQWSPRDVFSVRLAVEEALVNAIKHGNRYDPSKHVRVICNLSPDVIRIEITDEGPGFNPSSVPDPTDTKHIDASSGRGVMLMRSFMSRVEFNATGNQVVMEKSRDIRQ